MQECISLEPEEETRRKSVTITLFPALCQVILSSCQRKCPLLLLLLLYFLNSFLEMTQLQVHLSLSPPPPPHIHHHTQSPHTYETETGIQWKESRRFIFNSISDIAGSCHGNHSGSVVHQLDCLQFVSLLGSMLQLDPSQRILPSSALQHPFITMQHLAMHTNSLRWAGGVGCKQ